MLSVENLENGKVLIKKTKYLGIIITPKKKEKLTFWSVFSVFLHTMWGDGRFKLFFFK